IHPRTRKNLEAFGLWEPLRAKVKAIEPVDYLDFIALLMGASKVVTDSGGVQKEAYFFGVPCITLRDETEWIETVEDGWNALVGSSSALGFVRLSPVTFELGLLAAPGSPPAPWSWMTFEFVHASETHIFLNLLGLILISPTLEGRIGSARWALLFFVGGAAGALVFLLVHFGDAVLLVGASAGIFAVFGAYGRLYPRDRIALFLPIPGVPTLPVVEVVVIFLVLETILGLLGPLGIAWEAHVGALIFG